MVFPVQLFHIAWVPQQVGLGVEVEEGEEEGAKFASMLEEWHGLMAQVEIPMGVEVEGTGKDGGAVGGGVGLDNHMWSLKA